MSRAPPPHPAAAAYVGLHWATLVVGLRWPAWAVVGLCWPMLAVMGLRWLSWAYVGQRWLSWAAVGLRLVGAGGSKRGVDGCWRLEKRCWWVLVGLGCSKRGAVHQNVHLVVHKGVLVA